MTRMNRGLRLPDIIYYSGSRISESIASVFFAALFAPKRLFEQMPAASGYKNSIRLMAVFISLPLMMASMLTGVITAIVILPVGIAVGVGTSWLWAAWLSWATRFFCKKDVSTEEAFQVLAYSSPPLALAWGPYLGLPMALWNLWLNWRGLAGYFHIGGLASLGIITGGIFLLGGILVLIVLMLFYLVPENMETLLLLAQIYFRDRF